MIQTNQKTRKIEHKMESTLGIKVKIKEIIAETAVTKLKIASSILVQNNENFQTKSIKQFLQTKVPHKISV